MLRQFTEIEHEICTIDGLFTDCEIGEFLQFVESACDVGVDRKFSYMTTFANGKLIKPEWSGMIYSRLAPLLPEMYSERWRYDGAAKYIMYAGVASGQSFGIHTDTGCEYDAAARRMSKFTILVYLNDDFAGGRTIFYDMDTGCEMATVVPKKGRMLMFDIDRFHCGERVENGVKYWIGTELVCSEGEKERDANKLINC